MIRPDSNNKSYSLKRDSKIESDFISINYNFINQIVSIYSVGSKSNSVESISINSNLIRVSVGAVVSN